MAGDTLKIKAKAYLCPQSASAENSKQRLSAANPGAIVQAAKEGVAGNEALVEMLAAQTLQAEASGSLLANRPEIDLLLRLAGTTQISRAIREAGAKHGEGFVIVVAGRDDIRVPTGFEGIELARRELSASELGRVEKAALLNAKRA